MTFKKSSSLAALVVIAVLMGVPGYGSPATEQLLIKARSLEGRGLVELASRSWEQVLLADPNNVEALTGLARYAQSSGKLADAARYLDRLRHVNPNNPDIARIEAMKPLTEARPALEEAQRLAQRQDFEGALRAYRQAFGNEPPAGGWAISYFETEAAAPGGWDEAVAGLKKYIKRYPDSPAYSLALGKLLTYRQKTRAEGMQILEAVKGEPSEVERARLAWRQALVWEAGNAASLPSLRAYLARYPDVELQKLASRSVSASARPEAGHAPAQSPHEGQGYQALNASKLQEAENQFSAALQASPHSASALAGLGFVKLKQQDFDGAVPLFEQALALQPANKSVLEGLAAARFWGQMKRGGQDLQASHSEDAVQEFQKALDLRPQSTDAARALAGSYVQSGQAALAIPIYQRLVAEKPDDSTSWLALIKAQEAAGDAAAAVTSVTQMPASERTQLLSKPEPLIAIASAYAAAGDTTEATRLQNLAERSMQAAGVVPSAELQMELAGLYVKLNEPRRAVAAFAQLTRTRPQDPRGWEGEVSSLIAAGEVDRAAAVIEKMPSEAYGRAIANPGFLRAAAAVESGRQRYEAAEQLLRRASEIDSKAGKESNAGNSLQLADALIHEGKYANGEELLRDVIAKDPERAAARFSLLSLLENQKRDREALEELRLLPHPTRAALENDPGFVSLEAGIYAHLNRPAEALGVLKQCISRFDEQGKATPLDLRIQEAWLLVNQPGQEQELYQVLRRYTNSPDATAAQRASLSSIWSIWARRRASDEQDRGESEQAVAILRAAAQLLPGDTAVQGSLAGAYLRAHDTQSAYQVYKRWGLSQGTADDFSGAVGAAMSANDSETAARWLGRGLQKYPRDSRLLSLAGKQAAAQGNYDKAKLYLREALASLPAGESQTTGGAIDALSPATPNTAEQSLGALLVPGASSETAVAGAVARPEAEQDTRIDRLEGDLATPGAGQDAGAAIPLSAQIERESNQLAATNLHRQQEATQRDAQFVTPQAAALVQPSVGNSHEDAAAPQLSESPTSTLHQDISDDIAAIDSRNSPYFIDGATVQGRSGRGGVDKLMIEQADLGASTTVGNEVRLSLIAHPTYLDSGNPSTGTTPGFGSILSNGYSTSPTAFGIAAESQVSTRDFGMRLGLTPYNFPVRNWLGGLRLTPRGGPITILINRDTIMDTKLSFAGERDPGTNLLWGGVMANSATALGHWGTDKSGFYASAGYQDITGKGVASNSQLNATTGTYFKILSTSQGSLTAGLNLTGMHYDKNLSYFTLGQGGYFSPQQYFLANVPVRWIGSWNRKLQYSVAASLGVQHFSEDVSPYFPLLATNSSFYSAFASTGGNYNLDFRMAYQLAPNWIAGAFVTAGNARNYENAATGIYLKYLFQPRPFSADITAESVPDWKGAQPFGLPAN